METASKEGANPKASLVLSVPASGRLSFCGYSGSRIGLVCVEIKDRAQDDI